ncbi:SWIM zinc finger domain-containing protein [Ectobacillus antri]|uniref:SWIM zinc finger domain-containing protein n=1 Tax=Ectobacillus antri TaxID=2486280 RepID=A0ABT6H7I9_9BACI|nr:SWIM zinc finger family protein [Ectobacillus antri]MDG4657205.1 SWIM zinc finger domain-containing protein [Ectobacillus antri]MDG5755218.1 SWIM zinc finger domain-containing protein [Ectobacillus antri]
MLQHSIGKEEILEAADRIISTLSPSVEEDRLNMATGLRLYREGRVYNVNLYDDVLEGTVEDEEACTVQLPLHHIDESYCDCFQVGGYCQHMIALLFYAGASFGLVGEIMKRFKHKDKPVDIIPQLKTAKQLLQTAVYEENDYNSWLQFFEREAEAFTKEQAKYPFRQSYLLVNIFEDFYKKLARKAPRVNVLRDLFTLNAALFGFQQLLLAAVKFEAEKVYSYYNPLVVASRFVDEIDLLIDKLMAGPIPMNYDHMISGTGQLIHDVFFTHRIMLPERYFLYRRLWSDLLKQNIREEEERIALLSPSNLQPLALAHIAFIHKQDETAIDLLQAFPYQFVDLYIYWIDELCAENKLERAKTWLTFCYIKVKLCLADHDYPSKRELARLYLNAYMRFADFIDDTAGAEVVLQELLPYSFFEYSEHLLNQKQYRVWTDLQLMMGYDFIDGLQHIVREVEKEDREAVLPLYHRAVMQCIEMKNRPAYRQAVRYLKKLRTHYKKLKRTEDWERFIMTITASFSRLRALQEELRKGKLIDDKN